MNRASRIIRLAMLGAAMVLPSLSPAVAAERTLPGGTADSIIAVAKRLSPELKAVAFDMEASRHAIGSAGALADPTVALEAWDVNGRQGIGQRRIGIEQEFKLWGRQDLERDVARAEADVTHNKSRATAADLFARIKTVHAEYNAAQEALTLSLAVKRRSAELLDLLQSRYGSTFIDQQDVIRGRMEIAATEVDVARRQGDLKAVAARLNALAGRAPLAPLAMPMGFRRIKTSLTMADVQIKARAQNPALAASAGEVSAASSAKALKDLNYNPDLTLGARYVQRPSGADSAEFLVGFKLPLQFAAKDAEESAAASRLSAAYARNYAARLSLDGQVAEVWFAFQAARTAIRITETRQLPPARLSVTTARSGFQAGSTDLALVLDAERRLRVAQLELLKLKVDEQTRYAELERLAGDSL